MHNFTHSNSFTQSTWTIFVEVIAKNKNASRELNNNEAKMPMNKNCESILEKYIFRLVLKFRVKVKSFMKQNT